jgi:hypothetical protein
MKTKKRGKREKRRERKEKERKREGVICTCYSLMCLDNCTHMYY